MDLSTARGLARSLARGFPSGIPSLPRALPPGRTVDLGARGTTWVLESPAPAGAPTLLLLHGLGATAALNWHETFFALAGRYRMIALDHAGHGRGRRMRARFRLADCADDAAAVLDALGVERAIAVGYSMGGPIAELLWHRHRERVAGLVLCATARNFRGRREAALRDLLVAALLAPGLARGLALVPARIRRLFAAQLLRLGFDAGRRAWALGEIEGHAPRAVVEAANAVARFDSAPWAGTIDVPTAVVVMEQDGLVSPRAQRKLADAIPGATVHRVNAGHDACVSAPREFNRALDEACRSVARRAIPGLRLELRRGPSGGAH